MMVCACLFTCHMPLPSTNGVGEPDHTCAMSQNRNMVAGTCMFTNEQISASLHGGIWILVYTYALSHTISGSVGKTICPYTMCLRHQVLAWACLFPHMLGHSIISFYCEFIRLHAFLMPVLSCSSKRASLFTHEPCPSPTMWQHGHVCSHVDYDPAPWYGGLDMYVHIWTMSQYSHVVAQVHMLTHISCVIA